MMNKRIETYLETKRHYGIFILRFFIGLRLIYGVIDNIVSWDQMIEFSSFLHSSGFPIPVASAVISVYAQFICALLLLVGYKIRYATIVLIFNFSIALILVHIKAGDSIEGMTPALAMLFGSITLLFTGADKISIDHLLKLKNQ